MKKTIMSLSIFLLLMLFTGCATVISGTTQTINFESSPSGAAIFLDGERIGVTPLEMELKKNKYKSIRVELEGYHTVTRQLDKEYDLITLLSIFWDYSTTDLISGAAFKYAQNAYFIELQEKK